MRIMKIRSISLPVAVLCLLLRTSFAGSSDLEITCVSKKFDEKAFAEGRKLHDVNGADIGGIASKQEHWGYAVSFENKSFQPIAEMEVKYMIFFKQEQLGSKSPGRVQHQSGTFTVSAIPPHSKQAAETDAVQLKQAYLTGPAGGYTYYENGAKSKVADSLIGIWIRVYQNGTLFAEFAKPSALMTREKWE